jgi:hypothetical protein
MFLMIMVSMLVFFVPVMLMTVMLVPVMLVPMPLLTMVVQCRFITVFTVIAIAERLSLHCLLNALCQHIH